MRNSERLLKRPVLLESLFDALLRLVADGSEGQSAVSAETLLDKVVEEVLGPLEAVADRDAIASGDWT